MERCPDKQVLQTLLESEAGSDAQLQGHLEACADCRHTLEMLAGDPGTWVGAGNSQVYREEPALQELMQRLKAAESPLADNEIQALLDPSDKPGVLGQIHEYEITEVIGRGAMSIVFKANEPRLNRPVAVKVLSPRLASNGAAIKRFIREAQTAAAVHHENVVQMLAVGEDRGLPYLVMQYLDGESVQDRIGRIGELDVAEVVRIGAQAAAGLSAAHKQGLVHRDIKPANLMLMNNEGQPIVKITDFGLARAVYDTDLTSNNAVVGTPEYMSPEQARGDVLDQRSDLFSLGSALYAMCTGKSPFRADSAFAVLKRVCDETPTPVQTLNQNVPDWLAALIERLMAKNPADRFASADEVARLLQGYLAHLQTAAPAPTLPSAPRRNRLKGRGVVLMAATLLLVAVFAALLVRSLPIDDWRMVALGLGGLFGIIAMAACAFIYLWPIEQKSTPRGSSTEGAQQHSPGQRPG